MCSLLLGSGRLATQHLVSIHSADEPASDELMNKLSIFEFGEQSQPATLTDLCVRGVDQKACENLF
jgi:hypothetical protein